MPSPPGPRDSAVVGSTAPVFRRYLLVDDSETFLAAAVTVLEREGAIVVGTATTGAAAIRLAVELRPDVVLVDFDLGDECGLDVARALASQRSVRIVLISAYPENDLAELVATSPVDGFLSKSELSTRAVDALLCAGGPGGSRCC